MPPNLLAGPLNWLATNATLPEIESSAMTVANATSTVEQDRWVLIVDEVILVGGACSSAHSGLDRMFSPADHLRRLAPSLGRCSFSDPWPI